MTAASDLGQLIGRPDAAYAGAYSTGSAAEYYLEVLVNDDASGLIVTCRRQDGSWWTMRDHLAALGLRVDDLTSDADGWIRLDAISGLSYDYDGAQQRLHLTVLASRRNLFVLENRSTLHRGDSSTGALLNYDAVLDYRTGVSTFKSFTEQRLFGDWGTLSNTGVHGAGDNADAYVRLDTAWTTADPLAMRSLTAGDYVGTSLPWTRPVRLAGVQLRRNFTLRPDLVTYPVTEFAGEAAVPSTVDVYVNQVRRLSSDLPAGPFRIEAPPALNGAGQATVVVRDILGRDTVQTLDLYVVPRLLARGLSDYSLDAGLLRRDYGTESYSYRGGAIGSGTLRYGWRDWLTLESHAQLAAGLYALGSGALLKLGRYGLLNLSLTASHAERNGNQAAIGYQYVSQRFNLTTSMQRASRHFRDLPSLLGDLPARRQARAFVGTQIFPGVHLSASYIATETASTPGIGPTETRLVSAGFRQTLAHRISVGASAFRDLERNASGGIYVSFSMALGRAAQWQSDYSSRDDRGGISLSRNSPYERGLDWYLRGRHGARDHLTAGGRYTGDKGALSLGVTRDGGVQHWQAGARGALAFADDSYIAGRFVQDEFAVVSTNGVANVPVLHENRPAGTTNGNGYLLLSNLNAYQVNRVAIDPLAVPFGYRIGAAERAAVPRLSSGAVVAFSIDDPAALTLTLIDVSGQPLPAGSVARIAGGDADFLVGYDGVLFVTGASAGLRLRVETPHGECEAVVTPAERVAAASQRAVCR